MPKKSKPAKAKSKSKATKRGRSARVVSAAKRGGAARRDRKPPPRPPADDIAAIRERLKAAILALDQKAPKRP